MTGTPPGAAVPVGVTSKVGYGVSAGTLALAIVAYLTGDRSRETLATLVLAAMSALSLVVTQAGRYMQAKAAIQAEGWKATAPEAEKESLLDLQDELNRLRSSRHDSALKAMVAGGDYDVRVEAGSTAPDYETPWVESPTSPNPHEDEDALAAPSHAAGNPGEDPAAGPVRDEARPEDAADIDPALLKDGER